MEFDWLIFGDSPYINEIEDFGFAEKYKGRRIAVNRFNKCGVDYRVANDEETIVDIVSRNLDGKWIFNKNNVKNLIAANKLVFDNYLFIKTYYEYESAISIELNKNGLLLDKRSSAIPAINFAIQRCARNICLIGIDFNWKKGHYYDLTPCYKPLNHIYELRQYVKKFCQYANIYRVNPDSLLPLSFLPLKRINEL